MEHRRGALHVPGGQTTLRDIDIKSTYKLIRSNSYPSRSGSRSATAQSVLYGASSSRVQRPVQPLRRFCKTSGSWGKG